MSPGKRQDMGQGCNAPVPRAFPPDLPSPAHKQLGREDLKQDISHYREIFWTRSGKPPEIYSPFQVPDVLKGAAKSQRQMPGCRRASRCELR